MKSKLMLKIVMAMVAMVVSAASAGGASDYGLSKASKGTVTINGGASDYGL